MREDNLTHSSVAMKIEQNKINMGTASNIISWKVKYYEED